VVLGRRFVSFTLTHRSNAACALIVMSWAPAASESAFWSLSTVSGTTWVNASSRATLSWRITSPCAVASSRRVQRITLLDRGSPDATDCGKNAAPSSTEHAPVDTSVSSVQAAGTKTEPAVTRVALRKSLRFIAMDAPHRDRYHRGRTPGNREGR
jgi:hypothetical protein